MFGGDFSFLRAMTTQNCVCEITVDVDVVLCAEVRCGVVGLVIPADVHRWMKGWLERASHWLAVRELPLMAMDPLVLIS